MNLGNSVPGNRACTPYQPTIRERLVEQRNAIEARLLDIVGLLNMLDKNPEFERMYDLMSRTLNY